jgi:Bacterial regulatory proteins, gntR family
MMSADSTGQHETYVPGTGGHVLSSVIAVTTQDEGDQDPIDSRGYYKAREVVARRLEKRIRRGEFGWHMPLPSEPALSEWYGVSRTTVRAAIESLIAGGLVERVRGKGTFVIWKP